MLVHPSQLESKKTENLVSHLPKLIEEARKVQMTPEQQEEQRQSFAYGNAKMSDENITKEGIAEASQRLKLEQETMERKNTFGMPYGPGTKAFWEWRVNNKNLGVTRTLTDEEIETLKNAYVSYPFLQMTGDRDGDILENVDSLVEKSKELSGGIFQSNGLWVSASSEYLSFPLKEESKSSQELLEPNSCNKNKKKCYYTDETDYNFKFGSRDELAEKIYTDTVNVDNFATQESMQDYAKKAFLAANVFMKELENVRNKYLKEQKELSRLNEKLGG